MDTADDDENKADANVGTIGLEVLVWLIVTSTLRTRHR